MHTYGHLWGQTAYTEAVRIVRFDEYGGKLGQFSRTGASSELGSQCSGREQTIWEGTAQL